ncbi:MAG: hypothetical protein ACXADB_07830 [Candidatus Hermodarchaeia archaeon]
MISLRHTMLFGMGIRAACTETTNVPVFVQFGIDRLESEVTDGMYRQMARIVEMAVEVENGDL